MAAAPRHASVIRVRVGVSRDGRVQAMDVHAIFNGGAYGAFRPNVNFGSGGFQLQHTSHPRGGRARLHQPGAGG